MQEFVGARLRKNSWRRRRSDEHSQASSMEKLAPAIAPPPGIGDRRPQNKAVLDWVQSVAQLAQPENIFWCDGSEQENDFLLGEALRPNDLIKLNWAKFPDWYFP